MIYIPFKDSEFNTMCLINTETGEEFSKIENVEALEIVKKDANVEDESKHYKFDNVTEIAFSVNDPMNIEEFNIIFGIDWSNKPDAYDVQYIKIVQARKHKKRRINKKWLKRYGVKSILATTKGWKLKHYTDGTVEFIKE